MKTLDDILGERVEGFLIKENVDFVSSSDEILIDELIVQLENVVIRIRPIEDSDEITYELTTPDTLGNDKSLKSFPALQRYVGQTLSVIWTCKNNRGYFDLLIIGLHRLHPTLLILSEGCTLKVSEVA